MYINPEIIIGICIGIGTLAIVYIIEGIILIKRRYDD